MTTTLTDLDRLTQMRDAAEAVLRESGISENRWQTWIDGNQRLSIGVWKYDLSPDRINWNQAQWTISVMPPIDWRTGTEPSEDRHEPASLEPRGHATPLCLTILNAIDAMFWEDRER